VAAGEPPVEVGELQVVAVVLPVWEALRLWGAAQPDGRVEVLQGLRRPVEVLPVEGVVGLFWVAHLVVWEGRAAKERWSLPHM